METERDSHNFDLDLLEFRVFDGQLETQDQCLEEKTGLRIQR